MDAEEVEGRAVPPYTSFATLLNQLDRMEREGVPSRIDKTYLTGMAGGTQNQFRHALRSLGLIGPNGESTATLVELAKRPDERPALLARILRERYPTLVALGENATRGQLDEALAAYNLTGATARKAGTFFLAAATYAGLPLSPHFKSGLPGGVRRASGNGTGRRAARYRKAAEAAGSAAGQSSNSTPPGAVTHTVSLASGGTVTVAVSMNIFELSRSDRAFVLALVDALQGYPDHTNLPSQPTTGPSTTEEIKS